MKNLRIFFVPFFLLIIHSIAFSEISYENEVFEVYETDEENCKLMNIKGDILVSYPKDNCRKSYDGSHAIIKQFGKHYLYDSNGEICSYDNIQFACDSSDDYCIVGNSSKYGIISKQRGLTIIPLIYDKIVSYSSDMAVVTKNGMSGLLNIKSNTFIIPMNYDNIGDEYYRQLTTTSGYYLIKKNGKFGLINKNQQIVTPTKYDYIGIGLDGEFRFWDNMTKMWFTQNLTQINQNDKWGILDTKTGKEVIPCIYEEIQQRIYHPSLFFVKKNGKWGVVNRLGKVVIPFEYNGFDTYYWNEFTIKEDFFAIKGGGKNKNATIFDYKGRPRITGIEDYIEAKESNLYFVKRYGKWEIYDISTLTKIYTFEQGVEIQNINLHFLTLSNNVGWAIFDIKKQKYLTDFTYEKIKSNDKYAYCETKNGNNSFIIDLKSGNKRYLPTGAHLIDMGGSQLKSLNRISIMNSDYSSKEGVINESGEIVVPIINEYKGYTPIWIRDDFILVYNKGIYNNKGDLILEGSFSEVYNTDMTIEHNSILENNNKIFTVREKDRYGYYVYNGKQFEEMLPCVYSKGEAYYHFCRHLDKINISDVDKNIPIGKTENNTFAIIIANEKYEEHDPVDFATKDGSIFREYCIKTLGIPSHNIRYRENATLNNIRADINWLKDRMVASKGNSKIIFYYAGHGIPDEKTTSSYLLPIDGLGNDTRSAYSLSELYTQLGSLKAKQVTVFLDACFSGAKRDGNMLVKARGVKIKTKPTAPQGNMIVLSASQGNETAYKYQRQKHGLFTYFLLKKLQETNGNVTLKELGNYITDEVKKTSMDINGKLQTPSIQVSPSINMSFNNITL